MLLWLSLSSCGDSNLLDQKQIKRVIKETLEKIDLSSKKGNELVYHTGLVESKYVYLMQKGGNNVARGLFQCEPWVAVDICQNYLKYRKDLMKQVSEACKLDWKYFTDPNENDWRFILTTNVAAQVIMCRLHYRRVPKPLPHTIEEQAVYWKSFYNTAKGAGTPEKFLEIVRKYG